jgi:HD-like signal output (HDOD) protein
VCEIARTRKLSLCEAEDVILGVNHAAIGKVLADKWALPLDLEYGLVYHHAPQKADKINELVSAIHLADQLAHELGYGLWDEEVTLKEWGDCRESLNIEKSDYDKIRTSLEGSVEKAIDFLNIIS